MASGEIQPSEVDAIHFLTAKCAHILERTASSSTIHKTASNFICSAMFLVWACRITPAAGNRIHASDNAFFSIIAPIETVIVHPTEKLCGYCVRYGFWTTYRFSQRPIEPQSIESHTVGFICPSRSLWV